MRLDLGLRIDDVDALLAVGLLLVLVVLQQCLKSAPKRVPTPKNDTDLSSAELHDAAALANEALHVIVPNKRKE
jgi:hypothetical protein